jgi:hypothetical protein
MLAGNIASAESKNREETGRNQPKTRAQNGADRGAGGRGRWKTEVKTDTELKTKGILCMTHSIRT